MKRTASAVGRSFLFLARLSQDSNIDSRNFTDDIRYSCYLPRQRVELIIIKKTLLIVKQTAIPAWGASAHDAVLNKGSD